jgi:hypothetical protein
LLGSTTATASISKDRTKKSTIIVRSFPIVFSSADQVRPNSAGNFLLHLALKNSRAEAKYPKTLDGFSRFFELPVDIILEVRYCPLSLLEFYC